MRVWLLSRVLPSKDDAVAGVFVLDQARALQGRAQVDLLHVRGWSLRTRPQRALRPAKAMTYVVPPRRIGLDLSLAARLLARMIRRGRPDILHVHWSTGLRGVTLAGRLARVPVVFTEHGGPFPGRGARVPEARRALNGATIVLPVSDWLRHQLVEQGVTVPMRVVPNVVDPCFAPTPLPFDTPVLVAVVARLAGFDKGVLEIIDAAGQLHRAGFDIELTVVGDGRDRPHLEVAAAQASCPVRFTGSLDRAEIAEVLAASTMLVSATRSYETFGVAVAESLAAGRPVVATAVGAIPDLVRPGKNGVLVAHTDPALIADGMRRVAESTWRPDQIAATVAHCSPASVASALLEIYGGLSAG